MIHPKNTIKTEIISDLPSSEATTQPQTPIPNALTTQGPCISDRNAQVQETVKSITYSCPNYTIITSEKSITVEDPVQFACEAFQSNKNFALSLLKKIKENPSLPFEVTRSVLAFPELKKELNQIWQSQISQEAESARILDRNGPVTNLRNLGGDIIHKCKLGKFSNKLARASVILSALITHSKESTKKVFIDRLCDEFSNIHHHGNLDYSLKGDEAMERYIETISRMNDNINEIDKVEIAIACAFTLQNPLTGLAISMLNSLCNEASYHPNLLAHFEEAHRNNILLAALTSDTEERNKIIDTIETKTEGIRKENPDILNINKIGEFITIISQLQTDIHSDHFDENNLLNQFQDSESNQAWQKHLQFHPCVFLADILAPRYREFSLKLRQIALDQGVNKGPNDQANAIFDFSDKEEYKLSLPEGISRIQDVLPPTMWDKIEGTHLEDLINTPLINWPDIEEWMPQA